MSNPSDSIPYDLNGHVALVTGANHGIGAATATALAGCGASVLASYLRTSDPEDYPEPYRTNRAKDADDVLSAIRSRDQRPSGGASDATLLCLRQGPKKAVGSKEDRLIQPSNPLA